MHGPAVAVAALIRIGIDAEIVDHDNAGVFQPHPDEAWKIEHRMAVALARKEEQCVVGIGVDEALDELSADLIARLSDQGSDCRDHAVAFGSELFHGVDGRLQDAGERALPAGMRRADHARFGIDEQDRAAIGRGDADRKPFGAGDDGVRFRPRGSFPRATRNDDIRRMDLMHVQEMRGLNPELLCHAATVFSDICWIVARAEPAIEAVIDAVGHAALAREEGMAQTGDGGKKGGNKHQEAPLGPGWSLKPGSVSSFESETPSTLNIEPMPPRPPPVNRFNAPEISSETSGEAFAISAFARVSIPSRFRNSPCVTGPCTCAPTVSAARPS